MKFLAILAGFFFVIVGIAGLIMTPLLGIERTRAILEWSLAQGSRPMRLWSGVALILGVFIMYSIVGRRRAACQL